MSRPAKSSLVKTIDILHQFLHQLEPLKSLLRHSWLSSGRQESVAEHTWRMAMMAILLAPHLDYSVNLERVLKLILTHDIAEIKAGDFHAFKKVPSNKHQLEKKALEELVAPLPAKIGKELVSLWQEFEAQKTPEAKFAQALDKLEVLIQHNEADISTWAQKEYEFNYYYGYDQVTHSQILKLLRDLVLEETHQKISQETNKLLHEPSS